MNKVYIFRTSGVEEAYSSRSKADARAVEYLAVMAGTGSADVVSEKLGDEVFYEVLGEEDYGTVKPMEVK